MRLKKVLIGAVAAMTLVVPIATYAEAFGTVATQTLNARAGATTSAKILDQVKLGTAVEIVTDYGEWLKIALEDETRAFVKAEYINVHRVVATVQVASGLNVRDYPSTSKGEIIGKFYSGDEISVHYAVGDWYKVSQEGFEGFVHKDYVKADLLKYLPTKQLSDVKRVKLTQAEVNTQGNSNKITTSNKVETSTTTSSQVTATTGVSGSDIVAYAKQFLGNPYVYGGNSLTSGVDCSGFTTQVMKHFGINLTRSSSGQYANNGYSVSSNDLRAGDLLFYGYNGNVSHVALYIGDGQVIHANDERSGICISEAFSSYGKPFIGAKRVI